MQYPSSSEPIETRPQTRYARSGDVNIAYQVVGDENGLIGSGVPDQAVARRPQDGWRPWDAAGSELFGADQGAAVARMQMREQQGMELGGAERDRSIRRSTGG